MNSPQVTLVARSESIAELVQACAEGRLKFSGKGSLCHQVSLMGYKTTSLYEMVIAAQEALKEMQPSSAPR